MKDLKLLKRGLLIVIGIFAFASLPVEAETINKHVCLSNRNLYNISWDTAQSSLVTENAVNALTQGAIDSGYVTFPAGTSATDKEKYKINASLLSTSCYIENGKIQTCPTNDEQTKYAVSRLLESENGQYKNIIMEFNKDNGTFTVKIADLYGGKLKIRHVKSWEQENTNGINSATNYSGFVKKEGNYYIIKNVTPSKATKKADGTYSTVTSVLTLEFYINDSSSKCNNSYVSTIGVIVSTIDDTIEVDNPALTDDGYGCAPVRAYIDELINKKVVPINSEIEKVIKYNYASMCYKNKISYLDYLELKTKIQQQFLNLKQLIESTASSTIKTADGVFCEETEETGGSIIHSEAGRWWSLTCTESYSATGDKAKLVYAGAGFTYVSEFKATRKCTIQQTDIVRLKPQCHYWCETSCSYDEKAGRVEGASSAGPNEDFDACVNKCDGGKYSQSCINSCYQEVYESENKSTRDLPSLDKNSKTASFLEESSKIQKMSTTHNIDPNASDKTWLRKDKDAAGNDKDIYRVDVETEHCGTVGVEVSSYCMTHNGWCTVTENSGPAGCIDNPWEVYKNEINDSETEFGNLSNTMHSIINTGKYTIQIADSYLNNNGEAYIYEISSTNNSDIIKTEEAQNCTEYKTWNLGDQGDSGEGCATNTTTKTVKVTLADAYLSKKTGFAIYKTGYNHYGGFNTSTTVTKLELVAFDKKEVYYGQKKYYTQILSGNVNVRDTNPVKLVSYNAYKAKTNKQANIAVKVEGFGTNSDYSNQVDCFYGVYNGGKITDSYECEIVDGVYYDSNGNAVSHEVYEEDCLDPIPSYPPPTSPTPTPPSDDEGYTLIFRPIDLNDNFPNNRNPRWNWTSNASVTDTSTQLYKLLDYKVDPLALNLRIEEKGYTIYGDPGEIDYDITLTPANIRKIREYNKDVEDFNQDTYKNYLDYDMECWERGNRDFCISKFLSNSQYITYSGNTSHVTREDIAKCNNAYNGQCVDN